MNYLALVTGIIATLICVALIILTITFLRENRAKAIFTGLVFALIAVAVIWLGIQGTGTLQINLGISDKQFRFLLVGLVMCLFILKGILDIRAGSKNSQDKTSSSSLVLKNRLQIVIAILVTTSAVLILLVAFAQPGS